MDVSYGYLFNTTDSKNNTLSDQDISKKWNENESVSIDDAFYTGVNYFVMQSSSNSPNCQPSLSSYFVTLIKQNKYNTNVLSNIKNAYYAIIKPRFLMNTLSNVYWQDVQSLTNSDGGTYNSVLFVINTIASTVTSNTIAADINATNVYKILSTDTVRTPFTYDSIWCYQTISVAFELFRYVNYFKKNGIKTKGSEKTAVTTTLESVLGGYPIYLKNINTVQTTDSSLLLFLLNNYPNFTNMPNDKNCPLISTLQKYVNDIRF